MDEFDKHELKPTKLLWVQVNQLLIAETDLGRYTIKNHYHLYYRGTDMIREEYLGKFKKPKAKARKHYNEEAL